MSVSGPRLLTETRIWRDVIGVLPVFARKFFARFQSRFVALFAERLSARLLIVQCSRLAFVCIYVCIYICMYICMYIYPSNFNCVGAVSVVSSPYYEPRSTGLTTRRSQRDRARVEMEQARATWYWSD